MKISWDNLLQRIRKNPLGHLGGFSPRLLSPYFSGYSQVLAFYGKPDIVGKFGLWEFNEWFVSNAHSGPQGWASYCLLLTDTDERALDLFFEFRRIAKKCNWLNENPVVHTDIGMSMLELLKSDFFRERPTMYFGNSHWLPSIWAMWSGYGWAEKDLGVAISADSEAFLEFQRWLRERYEFAQDSNFGKLFEFLALDVKENALEKFFDHLDLFLEGAPPDAHTKKFQAFLDDVVAAVSKEAKKKGS